MSLRRMGMAVSLGLAAWSAGFTARAADANDDTARLTKELGGADANRLMNYLDGQIPSETTKRRLTALIQQMGDPAFRVREDAMQRLIAAGPVALPLLRSATSDSDKEIAARAQRSIDNIQQGAHFDLPIVAIRELARLKELRAIDPILRYLPNVAEDSFRADVVDALASLGVSGKSVAPALKQALGNPAFRADVIQLLLKSNDPEIRNQIKTFLADKDSTVRFYAAQYLLHHGDRDSVPALIGIVADAPPGVIWQQAEEALYALAGDLAPSVEIKSGSVADRKAAAEHWSAWWAAKGGQVLFGRTDDYPTDVAAVTETGDLNQGGEESGRVYEWRPEGKPRFNVKNLHGPVDVRVLPGNRVLVAMQNGRRVSELDFRGKVLWEQTIDDGPVSVMRLPNGNTFIATMERVMEVRRDGEVVYSYTCDPDTTISDANKLSDGRIAIISTGNDRSAGSLILLSPGGKELKRIEVDSSGALEAQPNGHVLVSQTATGRITEFDAKGKKALDLKVEGAWMATRLPDGNLLVAKKNEKKMVKIDPKGKVIFEHEVEGAPHSLHWR